MWYFSSGRERRLWLWVLAVVVAIFGSLPVAGELAAALQAHGLLGPASILLFLARMVLVAVTVIAQGLVSQPNGLKIVIAIGAIAVFLLLFLRTAVLVERSHLIEYGVLGTFVYAALSERVAQGRQVRWPWLLALSITSATGTLDEAIQLVIPYRVFDPVDILFNFLAASISISGCAGIGWAHRRRWRCSTNDALPIGRG